MRPPKARSLIIGLAGALGVLSLGVAGCSSSDTVLALTVMAGSGVEQVAKIHVIVTPKSGAPVTADYTPPMKDGGAIVASFFERISLPDSADGDAGVEADALDAAGAKLAWGTTVAHIEKNHAVAAQVTLLIGGPPPSTDGGAGGTTGGGGEGGGAGGAGGAGGSGAGGLGGAALGGAGGH